MAERPADKYRALALMLGRDQFTVDAIVADGQHRAHTIYKLLREYKTKGLLEERPQPTGRPGAQPRSYRFTPAARKALQKELEDLFRDLRNSGALHSPSLGDYYERDVPAELLEAEYLVNTRYIEVKADQREAILDQAGMALQTVEDLVNEGEFAERASDIRLRLATVKQGVAARRAVPEPAPVEDDSFVRVLVASCTQAHESFANVVYGMLVGGLRPVKVQVELVDIQKMDRSNLNHAYVFLAMDSIKEGNYDLVFKCMQRMRTEVKHSTFCVVDSGQNLGAAKKLETIHCQYVGNAWRDASFKTFADVMRVARAAHGTSGGLSFPVLSTLPSYK